MPLSSGQVVGGRYTVQRPLGAGGMGAVYYARDTRLNAPVALKEMVPQPGLSAQVLGGLRTQFRQEATILANLDHPHLVDVLDFFEEGSKAYIVMRFVEGESLGSRIQRLGPAKEAEVLLWADELLDALQYCHSRGVLHRDIKPQNVLIRPSGKAVLVDFGLVKLWDPRDPRTKTAMRGMGTPEYAPLEQYDAAAGHTDPRSDLYALGATLYHALTGRVPPTITSRILDPGALPSPRAVVPDVQASTEQAIVRAMEVHPSNRFATAAEMRSALGAGRRPPPGGVRGPAGFPTAGSTVGGVVTSHRPPTGEVAGPPAVTVDEALAAPPQAQPAVGDQEAAAADHRGANRLARVSLVLGLVSLASLCLGVAFTSLMAVAIAALLVFGLAAIVAGILALRRLRQIRPRPNAWRMAVVGLVLGVVSSLAPCVLAIVALGNM